MAKANLVALQGGNEGMVEYATARRESILVGLLIFAAALIIRLPLLGDPAADFDEQLYLLIGSKLWEGQLPYVDLWDRKPFLLFAIFAASSVFPNAILGYQILAVAAAAVGGLQIFILARRLASHAAAFLGAIFYLISFPLFSAPAGQSEVFLLPLLLGLLILMIQVAKAKGPENFWTPAIWAMFVGGIALQVKYTALPHCIIAGLIALAKVWNLRPDRWLFLRTASILLFVGLCPTLLIALIYATAGHFNEFFYANFVSVFDRGSLSVKLQDGYSSDVLIRGIPLIALGMAGCLAARRKGLFKSTEYLAFLIFTAASTVSLFLIGNIYIHYFLLVVPGLILIAIPFLDDGKVNLAFGTSVALFTAFLSNFPQLMSKGRVDRASVAQMVRLIEPQVDQEHCLYVYDGPSILYHLVDTCLPTRYPYPDHLNNEMEAGSIGADTTAEVRKILAREPGAIVMANFPVVPRWNVATLQMVKARLARDYRVAGMVFLPPRELIIYTRKTRRNAGTPPSRDATPMVQTTAKSQ